MQVVGFAIAVGCLLCCLTGCFAKRGFILTASKAIDAGSTEYFTFTTFDVPPGGVVSLKLLNWYTGSVLAESEVNVLTNINMWVEMSIPPLSSIVKAKLVVQGNFSDGYRINAEKEVQIRHSSVLTFVQTDKPIYKPTQTVRFRILPMDNQLKPLASDTVGDVWIEDPNGIRVTQWRKIHFKDGMVQLELPLSNEPPLGVWSIKTVIHEVTTTQNFEVKQYVLPKFEVKIKPPEFIMADVEDFSFEICALYSYGKKVDGKVKVKVTHVDPYHFSPPRRHHTYYRIAGDSVELSGLISGCYTATVHNVLPTKHIKYKMIEVFAEVIENGTDISANATVAKAISYQYRTMKFLGVQETEYFKPGIPYFGRLEVKKQDGEPATSEKVEICVKYAYFTSEPYKRCQKFITSRKGRVRFIIPPQSTAVSKIDITAEVENYDDISRRIIDKPTASLSLNAWYSPSDSYLQIQSTPDEMECEKLQRVKVRYTAEKGTSIKFYHKVISRGRLVQQGSHQRTFYAKKDGADRRYDFASSTNDNSNPFRNEAEKFDNGTIPQDIGEFDLSFDPRATMSPIARLLIYYVREDGEVVADSRRFRIAQCLLNKVNLHFRHEQQYPSTEASLLLSASPSSVCGIGMVDKSVRFLKPDNQFQIQKIFDIIEGFDVGKNTKPSLLTNDYCMLKQTAADNQNNMSLTAPPTTTHSHRQLTRLISYHADTIMAFEEAGIMAITDFELETRPCVQSPAVAIPYMRRKTPISARAKQRYSASAVPQVAALPAGVSQKVEAPVEEIRNFFPETWLWEMHTVGASGEMALKKKLPHTITQWIGNAVCVHPKTGLGVSEEASITAFQPFFVSFTLPYSVVRGEVLPLVVIVFNYLTECLPIKVSLEPSEEYTILSDARSHMMCVCGEESSFHKFVLKPTTLGLVNVTIYGYSIEDDDEVCGNEITARLSARDAVSKQLRVEAEGFPKEEIYNYFICPKSTNGSYATEVDLITPEDVVEGSARAFVTISGDVMAPALNGLQSLVKLPKGCGEQNMVLFTPNIFVLDYLTASGRLTPEVQEECIKNMKTGYQRELMYRHKDGSYSAFGAHDREGSLWLTAFVLKSFGQARRFIEIDGQDLQLSSNFVLQNQFENGCFQSVGTIYHKEMKGGLNQGEQSLAPMTAYVLIALIESGVIRIDQKEVQNAVRCLEEDMNPTIYALSLFAYACALAKENSSAQKYLQLIEDISINRGGTKYWDSSKEGTGSIAVSVETAAYYILARIELEGKASTDHVLPVVRWLAKQRNSHGGFISSQDTVLALQSLARYASVSIETQETMDMGLVVEADGLVKGFKLNEDNKLVTQKVQIPDVPTVVDLQAVGDGCALVQFSFRYNVYGMTGSDAFDLNVDVVKLGSNDCNLPRIGICMRYKIPEQNSNMVVVFIKMASGFTPDEGSLQALQSDKNVQLKRYEVDGNTVNLYFDELTNEQKCITFFVRNEIEIEEIKPATVKICDYYQPELQVTKEYTIPTACAISELPDLPRLPALGVDSDNSNLDNIDELDTSSPTKVPQTEVTTDRVAEDKADGSETDETVVAELSTTSDSDTPHGFTDADHDATELVEDSEDITRGGSEELENVFSSTERSEINIQEYTTVEMAITSEETEKEMAFSSTEGYETDIQSSSKEDDVNESLGSPNEEAMADDAFGGEENFKFSNFVEAEHDLDVPDGIEGNAPVSVLPPIDAEIYRTSPRTTALDCPVCSDEFPDDFDDLYCSSPFALQAITKDVDSKSVKILQDIGSFNSQPKVIKKFATLLYDDRCNCPQLQKSGNILMIVGADRTLWNAEKGKHQIYLTSKINVILTTSKAAQAQEAKRAKNTCTDDP